MNTSRGLKRKDIVSHTHTVDIHALIATTMTNWRPGMAGRNLHIFDPATSAKTKTPEMISATLNHPAGLLKKSHLKVGLLGESGAAVHEDLRFISAAASIS